MTFQHFEFSDSFQYAQYFHNQEPNLDFASANGEKWSKWKKWDDLTIDEKIGINHRGIMGNEIVFDIENKKDHLALDELLEKEGFHFSTWDTGGKGTHSHLFFDKPLTSNEKLYFVKKIEGTISIQLDESAVKGRRLIGIELGYHRKTGTQKRILFDSNGLEKNKFPNIPVEESKPPIIFHSKPSNNPSDCLALLYASKNKIPEGNRHLVLSKNFAIWTHNHPNREALRESYIKFQEMPATELVGWDKSIDEGKITSVNCKELEKFFESFGRKDIVVMCKMKRRCNNG